MVKPLLFAVIACQLFSSCNDRSEVGQTGQNIPKDSLQRQISALKPGLGEYMLSIQMHHNKLWFAGKNANWDLAAFELDEIKEQLEKIEVVETDRPEVKSLAMIYPPLLAVDSAIHRKDTTAFVQNYQVLTQTCNTCHQSVKFGFIRISLPQTPVLTNQDYRP